MSLITINLSDRSAIERIILTARTMRYYPDGEVNLKAVPEDEIPKVLRHYLIENPDNSELVLCDQGKYTLSVDDGDYTFYATLEMI